MFRPIVVLLLGVLIGACAPAATEIPTKPVPPSTPSKTTPPVRSQPAQGQPSQPARGQPSQPARGQPSQPVQAQPSPPPAFPGRWVSSNPGGGGAFNSPVVGKGIWAVGSDLSGAYVSLDAGQSWQNIGASKGLNSTHVASLALTRKQQLLIGSDSGLFLAELEGLQARQVWNEGYVAAVAASADPKVLYAAVHPQWNGLEAYLLRSQDGGQSWQKVSRNLPAGLRMVALRPHPSDPQTLVVLSGEGRFNKSAAQAWRSQDGGVSWKRLDPGQGEVYDLAYLGPNQLLLTVVRGSSGAALRSDDVGKSWREVAGRTGVLLQGKTLKAVDMRSWQLGNPDHGLWESPNLGQSWKRLPSQWAWGWSKAASNWGIGYSFQGFLQTLATSSDGQTLLWADSQFVYASTDGGRSFRTVVSSGAGGKWRSRGLDNAVAATLAVSPADPKLVYAGYFDMGLWRSDDGGQSWVSLNDPKLTQNWKGNGGNTLTVLPDPERPNVVWAQLGGDLGDAKQPLTLARSENRGQTWQAASGLPSKALSGLSLDPASPKNRRTLYVVGDSDLYKSSDDGKSWSKFFECKGCRFSWVQQGAVYVGGGGGLWRYSGQWQKLSLPSEGWTPDKDWWDWGYVGLNDVALRGGEIWAAVSGKGFYRSSDGGKTWPHFKADPYARSVALGKNGEVVTGSSSATASGGYNPSSNGVMVSSDGQNWQPQNQGLAYPFATQVRYAGGAWWVLSPGQGVLKRK